MKKTLTFCLWASLLLFQTACQKDTDTPEENLVLDNKLTTALNTASNGAGISHFILPKSDDFSKIPQDPLNPITQEKVNLGKLLYHETGLALNPVQEIGKETYSCASCHFASAGFQAGRFQGISEGGAGFGMNGEGREANALYSEEQLDVQPLKSPPTLNTAFQKNMLWNGQFGATGVNVGTEALWTVGTPIEVNTMGFEGIEVQAIAGLKVHRFKVNMPFLESTGYKALFDQAFPDVLPAERYTRVNAGLAIAAYERTLLSNKAPFQQWLKGAKTALTEQEKRGAILFFDKADCASCHNGPALNAMEFYALGFADLNSCPEEVFKAGLGNDAYLGRGSFTKNPNDNYKFKVPQLYNLKDSPFYGHGSSFRSLEEVVRYKNKAVSQNIDVPSNQLADEFQNLGLNQQEIKDIVAFLENGLRDPDLKRFQPESILSGNCFPFNDPLAKVQLGCN